MAPAIHLGPDTPEHLANAIEAGGGTLAPLEEAEAVVWVGSPEDLPDLPASVKWVQLQSAGIEHWVERVRATPGVTFTTAAGAYAAQVAEHALGLLIAGIRSFNQYARAWSWDPHDGGQLAGSTVAVIGAGGIGRALIKRLEPHDVKILAVTRSGRDGTIGVERIGEIWGEAEIFGGDDDDTIHANDTSRDFVFCGRGKDTVYVEDDAPDRDQLDSCETVVKAPPEASTDEPPPSVVRGTVFNDNLTGTPGPDSVFGSDGDDTLYGGDGDDYVDGEDGNDNVAGGGGNDQVYGRKGNDQVFGNDGNDQIEGGFGDDYVDGGAGNDTISGTQGSDRVAGGIGDDRIDAVDGSIDRIDCGEGNDVVSVDPIDVIINDSCESIRALEEAEAHERADGAEAVAPRDLLALGVRAAVVGDRHLVEADAGPEPQHLGGELRLDPEVVGDRVQVADEVAAEGLVADLHVGDRRVVEHVGQQREEAVAGVVPEEVGALRVRAAAQAGAEDGVGLAGQQRVDQRGDVRGRVLEVGVLDQQDVAAGLRDPAPHRGALAAVLRLREDLDLAVALGEPGELERRVVRGAVVDQEDLQPEVELEQLVDDLTDGRGLVVDGHDDAHQRASRAVAGVRHGAPC